MLPILILLTLNIVNAAIVYDPIGQLSTYAKFTNCLASDDYAADPYENNKFYRCQNGYQYSFRCAPGTIYFGNGLCNYGTPSTIYGGSVTTTPSTPSNCANGCPYTFTDTTQRSQFCSYSNFATSYSCCCSGSSTCVGSPCPYSFVDANQQSQFCSQTAFSTSFPCCCGAIFKKTGK